uniref:Uncharacterized protein n=1 Tax=Rhodnius prolixus TaxID=13249 RepID=T1HMF3_RHOPR
MLSIFFLSFQILPNYTFKYQRTTKNKMHVDTAFEYNRTINVRTVLFVHSDSCKTCWSLSELNLLVARRIMQDLIPKRIPKDFPALLTYIQTCVNTVKAKTSGKATELMLSALYDALGGYLHSVVIPILNEAFYAGNVDYKVTSELHYMLSHMMNYLGTNGASWSNPCDMCRIPTKVSALPLRMCPEEEACDIFVLLSHRHRISGSPMERNDSIPICPTAGLQIQIPFLDDNFYPSAIAVPLKDHALFSLFSECAVNIIPKYYIMAMRCLASARYSTKDIVAFNHNLHHWIISIIVPHLHELDRWYPGFGGVMRVVETMNRRGLATNEPIKAFTKMPHLNYSSCFGREACGFGSTFMSTGDSHGTFGMFIWILLMIFILLILLAGIFICLRCVCIQQFKKCGDDGGDERDEKSKINKSGSHSYGSVVVAFLYQAAMRQWPLWFKVYETSEPS